MNTMTANEIDFEISQMEIVDLEEKAKGLMLPEWGRWKRKGDSLRHLEYPPCLLEFRGQGSDEPNRSAYIADISDEDGNRIGLAVKSLPKPYRMLVAALYIARLSVNQLAKHSKTTRPNIDKMHAVALGMLSEKLGA